MSALLFMKVNCRVLFIAWRAIVRLDDSFVKTQSNLWLFRERTTLKHTPQWLFHIYGNLLDFFATTCPRKVGILADGVGRECDNNIEDGKVSSTGVLRQRMGGYRSHVRFPNLISCKARTTGWKSLAAYSRHITAEGNWDVLGKSLFPVAISVSRNRKQKKNTAVCEKK